jgi:phosphohistidine phosphatase SixA
MSSKIMKSNVVKVWVSVGTFVLSGASSIAIASPVQPSLETVSNVERTAPTLMAQGGEGGEGGEKPKFKNKLSGAQLVSALRQGGYIIYFRHAQTEKDYPDQVSAVMGKCDTQRMLSEEGWKQSKIIGEGFKMLNIPVDKVYSSQYCRAWQTADLAFGRYEKMAALNFPKAAEYTDAQKEQMRSALLPMLTATPAAGKNTVIVGHDDLFDAVTGIYPEPQGIAYIVKPMGGDKIEVIAGVTADEWLKMPR